MKSIFCIFSVVLSIALINANPEAKPLLLDGFLDRLQEIVHDRVEKLREIPQRLMKTLKINQRENVDSGLDENDESVSIPAPSDMIKITIKSFKDKIPIQQNENSSSSEYEEIGEDRSQRQIPIISDIERVKKVVEILEAVGEQVIPIIIQNITPQSQSPQNSAVAGIVENDRENRFLKALERPIEDNVINTTGNLDETENEVLN